MNSRWFEMFCNYIKLTIPEYASMDDFFDEIIPQIQYQSEDLREVEYYTDRRWLEFKEGSTREIFHVFGPTIGPDEGTKEFEYMRIVNGDVNRGLWAYLQGNKMIYRLHSESEFALFELGLLTDLVFVLSKHGDHQRKGKQKYMILINPGSLGGAISHYIGGRGITEENIIKLLYYYYIYLYWAWVFVLIAIPIVLLIVYLFYTNVIHIFN